MGDTQQRCARAHGNRTERTTQSQTSSNVSGDAGEEDSHAPCDHWLFPANPSLFLTTATANRLGTWIASRRRAVRHSIKAARRDASTNTPNIVTFFPPARPEGAAQLRRHRHDNLIHDAYCKKRRQKQPSTSRHAQPSIVRFLSLRGRLT